MGERYEIQPNSDSPLDGFLLIDHQDGGRTVALFDEQDFELAQKIAALLNKEE